MAGHWSLVVAWRTAWGTATKRSDHAGVRGAVALVMQAVDEARPDLLSARSPDTPSTASPGGS
jgi:hypothetical protein